MKKKRRNTLKGDLVSLPKKSGTKKRPIVEIEQMNGPSSELSASNGTNCDCGLARLHRVARNDMNKSVSQHLCGGNVPIQNKPEGSCDPAKSRGTFSTMDTVAFTVPPDEQRQSENRCLTTVISEKDKTYRTEIPSIAVPERCSWESKGSCSHDQNAEPNRTITKRRKLNEPKRRVSRKTVPLSVIASSLSPVAQDNNTLTTEVHLDCDETVELAATTNAVARCLQQLPKLHRFVSCEWFYSNIDRALLGDGSDEDHDFSILLRTYFPTLQNRMLKRVEWKHIREKLNLVVRVNRRCSAKFLLAERVRLEFRRVKIRFLQENRMFEYLDDDLPRGLPQPITIGCKVRAQLIAPQYGLFEGTVVGVDEHMFHICFASDDLEDQIVPDYRLELVEAHPSERVTVPRPLFKLIQTLWKTLAEKHSILLEMFSLRLNTEAARAIDEPSQLLQLAEQYVRAINQLIALNRSILHQAKSISSMYVSCMGESPPIETFGATQGFNPDVVQVAEDLLVGYKIHCEQYDDHTLEPIPDPEQLWNNTVKRLQGPPDLEELRRYLQPTIGSAFRHES